MVVGSLFMIATPPFQYSLAVMRGSIFLIQGLKRRGSELANWNFDEKSRLPQFLRSLHEDFDALDG
jgi:hypothetical protein